MLAPANKRAEPAAESEVGLQGRGDGVQDDCEQHRAEQQQDYIGQRPDGCHKGADGDEDEDAADESQIAIALLLVSGIGHGRLLASPCARRASRQQDCGNESPKDSEDRQQRQRSGEGKVRAGRVRTIETAEAGGVSTSRDR